MSSQLAAKLLSCLLKSLPLPSLPTLPPTRIWRLRVGLLSNNASQMQRSHRVVGNLQVDFLISPLESVGNLAANAAFAGDNEELVLHIYAAGSEIDSTITKQTSTEIAATSEDQIDQAEEDDPDYNDFIDGDDDGDDGDDDDDNDDGDDTGDASGDDGEDDSGAAVGGSGSGSVSTSRGSATTASALPNVATPASSSAPSASATAVPSAGTFKYLGCSVDSSTSRTLSSLSWAGTGLSVERCASYCSAYVYMGVEFGSE